MVDYSKWKDIEISDDEDDTHPNIDTPSLFRWRHQARVERMEKAQQEKEEFDKSKNKCRQKLNEVRQKLREQEQMGGLGLESLKLELSELEKQQKSFEEKEKDLAKKEKLEPWNVDTISHDGFTKTVVNSGNKASKDDLTEEEKARRTEEFLKKNEGDIKKYGMLQKFNDSKQFLQEHPNLVCEDTANYLVIWCLNLEMEKKHDLMDHVAHQCISMQYILELAKQLDLDPRSCISSFFSRIQLADKQYSDAFYDEIESFKDRIRKRAEAKLEEALREAEEEERLSRLGPGGLDPAEVFENLPLELQKCFESRDIAMLQETLSQMNEENAKFYLQQCIDSGLWIPDAKKHEEEQKKKQEKHEVNTSETK